MHSAYEVGKHSITGDVLWKINDVNYKIIEILDTKVKLASVDVIKKGEDDYKVLVIEMYNCERVNLYTHDPHQRDNDRTPPP